MEFYLEAPWIVGGDKHKALEEVDAIVRIDAVAGHLTRAVFWIHANRLDAAEAEYQQILEARPDGIEPYLEIADFDESRGDAGRFAWPLRCLYRGGRLRGPGLRSCGLREMLDDSGD